MVLVSKQLDINVITDRQEGVYTVLPNKYMAELSREEVVERARDVAENPGTAEEAIDALYILGIPAPIMIKVSKNPDTGEIGIEFTLEGPEGGEIHVATPWIEDRLTT